jgi:hypothetical protein
MEISPYPIISIGKTSSEYLTNSVFAIDCAAIRARLDLGRIEANKLKRYLAISVRCSEARIHTDRASREGDV